MVAKALTLAEHCRMIGSRGGKTTMSRPGYAKALAKRMHRKRKLALSAKKKTPVK